MKTELQPTDPDTLQRFLEAAENERKILAQQKRFEKALTDKGIVYYNLIGKLIRTDEIKPPKGFTLHEFRQAYSRAKEAVDARNERAVERLLNVSLKRKKKKQND